MMTTAPPPTRETKPSPHDTARWSTPAWLHTTLGLGVLSSLLLWLAMPPIGFAPAVWVAPIPLLLLVRLDQLPGRWRRSLSDDPASGGLGRLGSGASHPILRVLLFLPRLLIRLGNRPYVALWYSGFLFWALVLHWLRLPHWAGYFSWPALSALMANYTPLFVALSRVMVHRWRVSIVVACPVVWTGLELVRAHFLGGFSMASLGHAHYRWLELIQISDLAGAYAVSFVVMLAAACLARMLPWNGRPPAAWPLLPLVVALGATLAYGHYRLAATDEAKQPSGDGLKVAIVQVSFDTEFVYRPKRPRQIYDALMRQSKKALADNPDLDLIIWPETMLGVAYFPRVPRAFLMNISPEPKKGELPPSPGQIAHELNRDGTHHAAFLLGAEVTHLYHEDGNVKEAGEYNTSYLMTPDGVLAGRYDKMNAVMFGEYVPLGEYFPWLYALSPLRDGLSEGTRPESFTVGNVRFCPSICYESILPHHIRESVTALRDEGLEPDVLVNQTNSGWFWGSSELQLHLICNVFRAVECRKPMLVAGNTGISAWIDPSGAIRAQGPRRAEDILYATVFPSTLSAAYLRVGDWPAGLCLLACALAALGGCVDLWRRRLSSRQVAA